MGMKTKKHVKFDLQYKIAQRVLSQIQEHCEDIWNPLLNISRNDSHWRIIVQVYEKQLLNPNECTDFVRKKITKKRRFSGHNFPTPLFQRQLIRVNDDTIKLTSLDTAARSNAYITMPIGNKSGLFESVALHCNDYLMMLKESEDFREMRENLRDHRWRQ